jgi:hypothetical protein
VMLSPQSGFRMSADSRLLTRGTLAPVSTCAGTSESRSHGAFPATVLAIAAIGFTASLFDTLNRLQNMVHE